MQIQRGHVHALFAFDAGFEIRLSQVPLLFGTQVFESHRFPFLTKGLHRENQPIRIRLNPVTLILNGQTFEMRAHVTFFEVGAMSLEFSYPLEDVEFTSAVKTANLIQNSPELLGFARAQAEALFERAKPAIVSGELTKAPSPYLIFVANEHSGARDIPGLLGEASIGLAQILRGSDEPIGASEAKATLSPYVTYSDRDVVFASTSAAVILDETSNDVADILELTNVQALELRFIDSRLDRTLQSLYEENELSENSGLRRIFSPLDKQLKRLNTIHLDSTIIVDRVENSRKFASDSYLVQIHELAVNKMFLRNFNRVIDRKLDAIREITRELRDRTNQQRMEFLEWIIIVLIAIEVIPLVFTKIGGFFWGGGPPN